MASFFKNVGDFFLFCSGVNLRILNFDECIDDSTKFKGIGSAVFFTAFFAFLSSMYAFQYIFKSPVFSVIFGFIWGSFIFSLDRYIVSSIRKEIEFIDGKFHTSVYTKLRELAKAIPRLIIAIIIAMVISKPLEFKIFETEINNELLVMQNEVKAKQTEASKKGSLAESYDKIEKYNNEISRFRGEVQLYRSRYEELERLSIDEAEGKEGKSTGISGVGDIYKVKQASTNKAYSEYIEISKKDSILIADLEKNKASEQLKIDEELKRIAGIPAYDGIAARIDAIGRLTDNNKNVAYANFIVILLFLIIELAPIIFKILSDCTPYDYILKSYEEYTKRSGENRLRIKTLQQEALVELAIKAKNEYLVIKDKELRRAPERFLMYSEDEMPGKLLKSGSYSSSMSPIQSKEPTKKKNSEYPTELVPVEIPKKMKIKKAYNLSKSGSYTQITTDINLNKDEKCYFSWFCNLYEASPQKRQIINKKKSPVTNRTEEPMLVDHKGNEWLLIDNGSIYLTNKKCQFKSSSVGANTWFKIDSIISISNTPQGVRIDRSRGKSWFVQFDKEAYSANFYAIVNNLRSKG